MVSNIAMWHVHILAKRFEFVNKTLLWKTFKIKLRWPTYKFIKLTGNHFDRICVYQGQRLQHHDLLQWGASVWILSLTQQKVLLNNIRGINMEYRALLLKLLLLVELCRQVSMSIVHIHAVVPYLYEVYWFYIDIKIKCLPETFEYRGGFGV